MNSTEYAKRTQYKPIDFFFRGIADTKSKNKKIVIIDAFQILNDRYLGRMSVQNYFVIAENSVRINELNIIALEELPNYHLVMRENFYIPENLIYSLPISTRFLENDKDFVILLETLKDMEYKKQNLILTFFASSLVKLDDESKKRYQRLRKAGYKTCVSQFGEEYNAIDIFAKYAFDYLRCEAQYFDSTQNKKKVLSMIVKFCAAQKIDLIMEGVDSPAQYARFKREGVKLVTGRGVSKLSRYVTNEFLGLEELKDAKLEKYKEKLQKDLNDKQKKEDKELQALRQASLDRIMAQDTDKVMPLAPRPELAKSPYQVRLEQQRNQAKKSAQDRIDELTGVKSKSSAEKELALIGQMGPMRFEGDVQAALSLTYAQDVKKSIHIENGEGGKEAEVQEEVVKENVKDFVTKEESGIEAPSQPDLDKELKIKEGKKIKADRKKEEKLMKQLKSGSMFDTLDQQNFGFKGFGVTLHISNKEEGEPDLVGMYNEKGQWTDEEGNVYDGYFDKDNNWVEYEKFDSKQEGHYNENYQWVDIEGNVYDGYFNEDGLWIDYTYTDENGEIVDNGYFDDKLKKWVPFGYFDEDGTYHKF